MDLLGSSEFHNFTLVRNYTPSDRQIAALHTGAVIDHVITMPGRVIGNISPAGHGPTNPAYISSLSSL